MFKVALVMLGLHLSVVGAALIHTKGYRDTLAQVRKTPHHLASLIVITTATDCPKCEQALELYEEFSNQVTNVVRTFVLDCKVIQNDPEERSIIPSCDVSNVDSLPALTFLSPPKKEVFTTPQSYLPVENQFKGTLSVAALIESVEKFAPIYSVIANEQEYFETIFLKDKTIPNKVLLCKPDEKVPMWWRGLSAKFLNRLEFAEVDSDEPHIYKQYKVPRNRVSVVVLEYDPVDKKYHHEVFKGEYTYENLEEFLERFALKQMTQKEKSVYEEDPTKWKKVEEIQISHLKSLLDIPHQWVALHIRFGNVSHPLFKGFKKNFTALVKIYEVRCSNETQVAQIERLFKMDRLQQLIILPFQKKTIKNYIVVREKDTFASISEFMYEAIARQTSIYHVVYEQLLNELQLARQEDLFPVLWFYKSRDFFWNVVAATYSSVPKYQKHLKFLFHKDPTKEQREQWEVTKYPHISTFATINVESGQHQKYDFQGAQTVPNLLSYLNQVAQENEKSKLQSKVVDQAEDQEDLERLCLAGEKQCVIAILDTVREGKFNTDQDVLHSLRLHFKDRDLAWLWIDGRCHQEILNQFKLDANSLPHLLVFNPLQSKFARHAGDFTIQQLIKFIDSLLERKSKRKYKLVEDYIEIREQNCALVRANLRKSYLEDKERRQHLFAQAERNRDLENAKIQRIKEQKRILEDYDEDEPKREKDDWAPDDL